MTEQTLIIIGTIAFIAVGGIVMGGAKGQSAGAPAQTSAAGPKKAEEQFKNIEVLKGIPADLLIPGMQFITASLGVECEFCHVEGAFEKDDKKPKQTARKMMEMMFAINKDNFEGHREVTCYSCHRGSADPVGMPPVMAEEPKAALGEASKAEASKGEAKKVEEGRGEAAEGKEPSGPPPDDNPTNLTITSPPRSRSGGKRKFRLLAMLLRFGARLPFCAWSTIIVLSEPMLRVSGFTGFQANRVPVTEPTSDGMLAPI